MISGLVTTGFGLMWLLVGLNILAGGGHPQKYMLFGLLTILLCFAFTNWRSARKHREAADGLRLLVMMDKIGLRWLYYDAHAAAIYDYKEDDNRVYIQQDMPWNQVLDVYVEHEKYYYTLGKIVVLLKNDEGQTERRELLLSYFEDKEIARVFMDEMLYMFVISR